MDHGTLLHEIKKQLASIEVQVRISNANNELDINHHAENFFIPLINLLFKGGFKNLNYKIKNHKALDLYDPINKIAIQVTSDSSTDKIKDTISKLLEEEIPVSELYFLMLQSKQKKYKEATFDDVQKHINGKFDFNLIRHVLDLTDVYEKVSEINNYKITWSVYTILRDNFFEGDNEIKIYSSLPLKDFKRFKESYFKSCLRVYSKINFYGLSVALKPREIEMEKLFIEPIFTVENTANGKGMDKPTIDFINLIEHIHIGPENTFQYEEPAQIDPLEADNKEIINSPFFRKLYNDDDGSKSYVNIFNNSSNVVVLGNPGSGKSSFIKYTICQIVKKEMNAFANNDAYRFIPFYIELHKYNKYKNISRKGILTYLYNTLKEDFQITLSQAQFEVIIKKFPCLFFFDAVDEIFDIFERIQVRNDIENFCDQHSKARVIVTSRYESYKEVSFAPKRFSVFSIMNFTNTQINKYVSKWYAIEIDEEDPIIDTREIKACLNELESVETELKTNPLLLSLILILYKSNSQIPASKMAIYENCVKTLVEVRDSQEKKLGISLLIRNHHSVFSSIAYWQFMLEKDGKSIPTYEKTKNYITEYLMTKLKYDDENLAEKASIQFLDFSRIRSIYVENKFIHKTFSEYYVAYYIYSHYYVNNEKRESFFKLINDHIGTATWAVILELLICKVDSQQDDIHTIDRIIDDQIHSNQMNAILFILHTSNYLNNISYHKQKELLKLSIDRCLHACKNPEVNCPDIEKSFFAELLKLNNNLISVEILDRIFEEKIATASPENLKTIELFIYEYTFGSSNTVLLHKLPEDTIKSSPLYFILFKLKEVSDFTNYFSTLKEFINFYSEQSLLQSYSSFFGQKLFYTSISFNWIISYYLFNTELNPIKRYNMLVEKFGAPLVLEAGACKMLLTRFPFDLELEYRTYKFNTRYKFFIQKLAENIKLTKEHISYNS